MNIEVSYTPSKEEISVIYDGLVEFNEPNFPEFKEKQLACYLKDETGELIGGLISEIFYENIYVKYFWLSEKVRGNGNGKALLARLELEALNKGIENIFLDTYSFQAPEFYKKYGFSEVARLQNYPRKGVDKVFFTKKLIRT